jgi:ribosomal protein S18 acetylase RimI-like enzyme
MSVEMKVRRVDLPGAAPRIDGLVVRHVDLERDVAPLAELIGIVNLHDGVDWVPSPASLAHDLAALPGRDAARDILVAEAGGAMVGTVQTRWRIRGERVFHHIEPSVRPDLRHRGLGRALLAWAERHIAAGLAAGTMGPIDRPHVLAGWADLEIPDVAPFAAAAGYVVEGYGIMMTRSIADPIPDAPLPAGLEVRPVRPDDHRRIWDADVEAFRDHRDPSLRTEDDYVAWFTQPDIDTSLWEVAWDGDEVAGSVMNFIFREENARLGLSRGWLEHVSVRRPWRKRGLASALMVRAMRRLREMGLAEAALGADAENISGAVRLYESLGFRRIRTGAGYRKAIDLPAGNRPPTLRA